jgi:WD40 repeat protein
VQVGLARIKPELSGLGRGTTTGVQPREALLACGGGDGLVRVYSLRTQRQEFTLHAHDLSVTSVSFSPDGESLATAGQEGDMHIWNVKRRRRLFTLHGHSGAVWDLAYTPKGSRLVSAGSDFLVRVWDAAASQEVVTLPFLIPSEVSALAYGPPADCSPGVMPRDRSGGSGIPCSTARCSVSAFPTRGVVPVLPPSPSLPTADSWPGGS